jgi:hypothetical protein
MGTSANATGITRYLLEALGKFASARLRQVGALRVHPQWQARATICERCALRVVRCNISYCGNPLLQQIDRDPALDGCGCPCRDKAKSPSEHCPIDSRYHAAQNHGESCSCKWCEAEENSKSELVVMNQSRASNREAQTV